IAKAWQRILLSRMKPQRRRIESLLTKLPIAGVNRREPRFGTLTSVAFQGFGDGGKLALFIAQRSACTTYLRISPLAIYANLGCDRRNGSLSELEQRRDQPCLDIDVGLYDFFGVIGELASTIGEWSDLGTRD